MTGTAYRSGNAKSRPAQQNRPIASRDNKAGRVPPASVKKPANSDIAKRIQSRLDPFEVPAKSRANTISNTYAQPRSYAQPGERVNQNAAVSADMRRRALPTVQVRQRQGQYANRRAKTREQILAERKNALKAEKARVKAAKKAEARRLEAERKLRLGEIAVKRHPISITSVMLALVFTVMSMVLIYSGTQIYEHTHEISVLKDELKATANRETELTLELEIRDDIRTIERIARERIGMVKGDLVEKRFVSLNDTDDRIELIGDDTIASAQPLGETASSGLLSGFFSALFGNFK